ncbi:unnamed protein product [Caenorhabditis angaria]|uniref:Uncharacterized protein n=1 Tax=Caenorhabditis angaria TaxID=860376 RepID=A0A9P1I8N9_9PELO|nr:unnamed protein product [Caenorhabditis angaria]
MVMIHDGGLEKKSNNQQNPPRFVFGKLHINSTMKAIVSFGIIVILMLVALLYFKFRKAMFILLVPTTVSVLTVIAIVSKKHRFVWPVVAISMFHVILSIYALLVFSFYFFFKPFYILMVSNWAFDTMHNDKNAAFYLQSAGIYSFLIVFMLFNAWQANVAIHYIEHINLETSSSSSRRQSHQPTVVVVNKPMY